MAPESMVARYRRDGFVFPLEAFSESQALVERQALETVEASHGEDPNYLYALNGGIALVVPVVDALTRHPSILDRVEELLGPNLILFGAALWAKPPHSNQRVSWHQDLTYWGLDGAQEVTAWLALSPATVESGCMRMVPGTHQRDIAPHRDTFEKDNLLSRGQELAEGVNEDDAINVELRPGEFSLHHGRTFHGSHANRSDDRRIGFSFNYITPAMKNRNGLKPMATLVRGVDDFGHFDLAPPPSGLFHPADVERLRRAKAIGEEIYYEGTSKRLTTDAIGRAAN